MKIFGIDFTSAPRPAKPITCAACALQGSRLTVADLQSWSSFAGFEDCLSSSGPWTLAVDFPLGQPRRLVQALGWPQSWEAYVAHVGQLTKAEFVAQLDAYRAGQPRGDKHHLRHTDKLAGACSPMMLYGVPVGKMFFAGAPRLQRADVSVLPCRPTPATRTVVEGYPALVARALTGRKSYKSDQRDSPSRADVRGRLLAQCRGPALRAAYGISLHFSEAITRVLQDDATGDLLDAVFCAVQAAAFERTRHSMRFTQADALEGWIVDPTY